MLSKKDLIVLNQQFHTCRFANESSLDYALGITRQSRNWLKTAAILMRAILVDHVFEDGNKRTAAAVMRTYLEMQCITYDDDSVNKTVLEISKRHIKDIRKIERMIKNATK